jgi:hypothetical protein
VRCLSCASGPVKADVVKVSSSARNLEAMFSECTKPINEYAPLGGKRSNGNYHKVVKHLIQLLREVVGRHLKIGLANLVYQLQPI